MKKFILSICLFSFVFVAAFVHRSSSECVPIELVNFGKIGYHYTPVQYGIGCYLTTRGPMSEDIWTVGDCVYAITSNGASNNAVALVSRSRDLEEGFYLIQYTSEDEVTHDVYVYYDPDLPEQERPAAPDEYQLLALMINDECLSGISPTTPVLPHSIYVPIVLQ